MITQLFNSWQTLSKQANTYQLDRGVSEFVCLLTGPHGDEGPVLGTAATAGTPSKREMAGMAHIQPQSPLRTWVLREVTT